MRNRIERKAAPLLIAEVRPKIPSKTLRKAIRYEKGTRGYRLTIPYYWARYVHDGRGPIRMPPGRYLVYFRNPSDDPRLRGGRPKTEQDVDHLTRAEFLVLLGENDRRRRAGQPPLMIVKRTVGPMRATPFFKTGLKRAPVILGRIAEQEFGAWVERELERAGLLDIEESAEASFG